MAIKLKEMIQNELAPAFLKKGFTYDKAVSKPRIGLYIFSKGEPELSTEEQLQYLKHKIKKLPNREEIRIYCNRMKTDITVDLLSYLKKPRLIDLAELSDAKVQLWWPINNEEKVTKACKEILDLMDQVGWQWFVL